MGVEREREEREKVLGGGFSIRGLEDKKLSESL